MNFPSKITWHIEKRKISDLKMNERNPRRITEKGLKDLGKSIDKFGLAEPIVINLNGNVIGGHARIHALDNISGTAKNDIEANCYLPSRKLTKDEERELSRRLNRNVAGEWDWDILSADDTPEELLEWGFEDWELGTNTKNDEKEINENVETKNECPKCGYKF